MRAGGLYIVTGQRRAGKTQWALYSAARRAQAEVRREATRVGKVVPLEFWTNAKVEWSEFFEHFPELVGRCVQFRDAVTPLVEVACHAVEERELPAGVVEVNLPFQPTAENPLGTVKRAIVVIDEAAIWFPEGKVAPEVKGLFNRIGHLGVELWMVTPDVLGLGASIRRAVSRWYFVVNGAENPPPAPCGIRPFLPGRKVLGFRRINDKGDIREPDETLRHGVPRWFWDCYDHDGGVFGYAVEDGVSFDAEESKGARKRAWLQFGTTWAVIGAIVVMGARTSFGSSFVTRLLSRTEVPPVAQIEAAKGGGFVPSEIFGAGAKGIPVAGVTVGEAGGRALVRDQAGRTWLESAPGAGVFQPVESARAAVLASLRGTK